MPEPVGAWWDWLGTGQPVSPPGGGLGTPDTAMGRQLGRATARGAVRTQLPGLRQIAPWLARLATAHPLGAAAAVASPFVYGALRKQIDPLWAWTGLEPDPWGMGPVSERGIAELDPYAAGILEKAKIKPTGAPTVAPSTPQQAMQDYLAAQTAVKAATTGVQKRAVRWGITTDPSSGINVVVGYDEDGNPVSYDPVPYGREPESALAREQFEQTKAYQAEQQRQAKEEAEATRSWRQQQLAEQKAQSEQEWGMRWKLQAAQLESQRQAQLAQLRANPASWLEYSMLAGTTPGLQPWMIPLMPPGYTGVPMGGPLPGWPSQAWGGVESGGALTPEQEWERQKRLLLQSQTASTTTAPNLPQLTQPSRQYQARMGPTAMAEYGGYERMRTGITPEELQFRLWSQAPPGGQIGGLNWMR